MNSLITSPSVFACIDTKVNIERLDAGGEEFNQCGLQSKDYGIQSSQPVTSIFGFHLFQPKKRPPDESMDEKHAPEADIASLVFVQLLQGQKREESGTWKVGVALTWI